MRKLHPVGVIAPSFSELPSVVTNEGNLVNVDDINRGAELVGVVRDTKGLIDASVIGLNCHMHADRQGIVDGDIWEGVLPNNQLKLLG